MEEPVLYFPSFCLLPHQFREDRWIGDREGIELKFGDPRVTSFGDARILPFSLEDTIKRSLLTSACFNGLADTEELHILRERERLEEDMIISFLTRSEVEETIMDIFEDGTIRRTVVMRKRRTVEKV
ncbi:hypothetical protein Y032_0002g1003 [Ancylostoma ceylanicum]|uniref:Uncharacterized protein n=1 Tax=Ancylostoma ceylanicum TaxID=53326 RepID=A0A016VYG5_9BILA|nr:hypothetical protein Y032_0002g1003 [Ancylostoma ceylanicum]